MRLFKTKDETTFSNSALYFQERIDRQKGPKSRTMKKRLKLCFSKQKLRISTWGKPRIDVRTLVFSRKTLLH
jgi:hypothetical protein